MELINEMKIEYCQGLAIDNNNRIYISTNNKFYIYNLEKN